jgi:hypothetical protein
VHADLKKLLLTAAAVAALAALAYRSFVIARGSHGVPP